MGKLIKNKKRICREYRRTRLSFHYNFEIKGWSLPFLSHFRTGLPFNCTSKLVTVLCWLMKHPYSGWPCAITFRNAVAFSFDRETNKKSSASLSSA